MLIKNPCVNKSQVCRNMIRKQKLIKNKKGFLGSLIKFISYAAGIGFVIWFCWKYVDGEILLSAIGPKG